MFEFLKFLFSFIGNILRFIGNIIIGILNFISKYFKSIVFLTIVAFIIFASNVKIGANLNKDVNLQKIKLNGSIVNPTAILKKIDDAKNNVDIKGVLFMVNSGGGDVASSVEIAYAIKELSKVKPVVAYASGTMASGSYYASIWANKIIANPGSLIGSIGVVFQNSNVEGLMEKLGIKEQTIKAGKYKEVGTSQRSWLSYEKKELEKVINDTYDMFITDVSKARGLKKENYKEFADAHIFTARQAKAAKLIDEVGTLSVAKNKIITLAKVKYPVWNDEKKIDEYESFLDKIINKILEKISLKFQNTIKAY